jgi:hypothetical protein
MKRFAFLTLLAMSVIGCGDDGTGPGSVAGRYELRTVNGGNVPYVLVSLGNDRFEVTSGSMQISKDNSFSVVLNTKTTESGATTSDSQTTTGTWALTGNQITFMDGSGTNTTGVITGDQLTVVEEGISLVFRK